MLLSATPLRASSGAPRAFARAAPSSSKPRRLQGRSTSQKVYAFSNNKQFSCPWNALGLQPGADEHAVKAAYRRLAKKYHPDVLHTASSAGNSSHDAAQPATSMQFLNISEAYGFLMQQLRSGGGNGDDSDGGSSRQQQGNSAAFHDWYWSFRMRRTWQRQQAAKQQQQQAAAVHGVDPKAEDACGCSDSGSPAAGGGMGMNGGAAAAGVHGATPQNTEALRSQLAGLRHRAAIRKNRPAASAGDAHTAAGVEGAQAPAVHPAFQPGGAVVFAAADGPSDSADPLPVAATTTSAAAPVAMATVAVGDVASPASATTQVAVQAAPQHHAQEQQQQQQQQHAAGGAARRRFASNSSVRDALKEQLHGMRRKAAIREQFYNAGMGAESAAAADMPAPAPSAA